MHIRNIDKRRYTLGLGPFNRVELSQARTAAANLNALDNERFLDYVENQKNKNKTHSPKNPTFRDAAKRYADWRVAVGDWEDGGKEQAIFAGRVRMYAFPAIGALELNNVTVKDVSRIAIDNADKPCTVDRVLTCVKQVFDWSKANDIFSGDNPASKQGALKYLLPQRKLAVKNRGAISVKELPILFKHMFCEFGKTQAGRCFLFAILTATRSQTARLARWDQIDFERKEWNIPASQLKIAENGGLIVPLSDTVLNWMKSWRDDSDEILLFSNRTHNVLSDDMLSRLIPISIQRGSNWIDEQQTGALGYTVRPTLHGVARATFRTWAQDDTLGNDRRFDARTAELCLHHKVTDGYNGTYERNTSYLRRREMMTAWSEYCFSLIPELSKSNQ